MSWFLVFILVGAVGLLTTSTVTSDVLPIGVLTDFQTSEEIQAAVESEISRQNSKQTNLTFEARKSRIDLENSFTVGLGIVQLISDGVFAILGTHKLDSIDTIRDYASAFRMPFLTTGMPLKATGKEEGYDVYMRPCTARAIADMIKFYEWKNIVYIFNSYEGLQRWQQIQEQLVIAKAYNFADVNFFSVKGAADACATIESLDKKNQQYYLRFLLDLPIADIKTVLARLRAKREKHLLAPHSYLIIDLGFADTDWSFVQQSGLNVIGLRMTPFVAQALLQEWRKLFPDKEKIWDTRTNQFEASLAVDAATALALALRGLVSKSPTIFTETVRNWTLTKNASADSDWMSIQPSTHGLNILKALKEVEFDGFTGPVKFDRLGFRRDYRLDVLEVTQDRRLNQIGYWHSEKGLTAKPVTVTKVAANRTWIVTTILSEPYLMMREESNLSGNDRFEGYCVDLLKKVSRFAMFDYSIHPVKDGKYGRLNPVLGTWDGMIGELVRGEADLAVAPLTITSEREKVVDFSKPFLSFGISIMMKKSMSNQHGAFSFANPFATELWLCIVFAYIGSAFAFFCVNLLAACNGDDLRQTTQRSLRASLFFCLWPLGGAPRVRRKSLSERMVIGFWWIFIGILTAYYTAKLIVMKQSERQQNTPINSVKDLLEQRRLKPTIIDSGSTAEFFRTSTDYHNERLWWMMNSDASGFVRSTEEGVQRVRDGGYAFLSESSTIDYVNQKAPCDTKRANQLLNFRGYGIATSPESHTLRYQISLAILELQEAQVLATLEGKWFRSGSCYGYHSGPRMEKLRDWLGIFYVLIGAVILALVITFAENLYRRFFGQKQTQTSHDTTRDETFLQLGNVEQPPVGPQQRAHPNDSTNIHDVSIEKHATPQFKDTDDIE